MRLLVALAGACPSLTVHVPYDWGGGDEDMTLADDALGRGATGFEGGVAGLGLSDLLQLNAQNRFSGCFRIEHEQSLGVIFFRDGEIVHAERGDLVGEPAFRE